MATSPDVSKLTFAELNKRKLALQEEAAAIEAAMEDKRGEELKVLADGYAKKLEAAGFEINEGIEAMSAYLPARKKRAARGSKAPAASKAYEMGTVYRNPKGPETWTGGTKGQLPAWLRQQMEGLEGDAKAAKFKELAKR